MEKFSDISPIIAESLRGLEPPLILELKNAQKSKKS